MSMDQTNRYQSIYYSALDIPSSLESHQEPNSDAIIIHNNEIDTENSICFRTDAKPITSLQSGETKEIRNKIKSLELKSDHLIEEDTKKEENKVSNYTNKSLDAYFQEEDSTPEANISKFLQIKDTSQPHLKLEDYEKIALRTSKQNSNLSLLKEESSQNSSLSNGNENAQTIRISDQHSEYNFANTKLTFQESRNEEKESEIQKDEEENNYSIGKGMIFLQIVSIILYITDVISDFVLALQYFISGRYWYGGFTICCIWTPSIWITLRGRTWRGAEQKEWKDKLFLIFLFILNMEPVIQYYYNFKDGREFLKAKKAGDRHQQKVLYEQLVKRRRDVAQLRYWEGVLEAIPQLMLQLHIMLTNYDNLMVDVTLILQTISLFTSTLGVSLTFFNYGKTWIILKNIKMGFFGHLIRCLRWFLPMICRVLSIAVLSTVHPISLSIVLSIQTLIALLWRIKTHKGVGVILVQSLIDVLVARDDSLHAVFISNMLLYIQDIAMLATWAYFVTGSVVALRTYVIVICVTTGTIGRILHIGNKWMMYKYEKKRTKEYW